MLSEGGGGAGSGRTPHTWFEHYVCRRMGTSKRGLMGKDGAESGDYLSPVLPFPIFWKGVVREASWRVIGLKIA